VERIQLRHIWVFPEGVALNLKTAGMGEHASHSIRCLETKVVVLGDRPSDRVLFVWHRNQLSVCPVHTICLGAMCVGKSPTDTR